MRHAGESIAPDLARPIIGYRDWVQVGDEILSPLARATWTAEPMQAECLPSCRGARGLWRTASAHPGPAPDPGCACGIYAPAVHRWESILGRPAPAPTDDRGRLNPSFVEWMLGFPDRYTAGEAGPPQSQEQQHMMDVTR